MRENENIYMQRLQSQRCYLYGPFADTILMLRPFMKSPARFSAVFVFVFLLFGAFVCTRLLNSPVSLLPTTLARWQDTPVSNIPFFFFFLKDIYIYFFLSFKFQLFFEMVGMSRTRRKVHGKLRSSKRHESMSSPWEYNNILRRNLAVTVG